MRTGDPSEELREARQPPDPGSRHGGERSEHLQQLARRWAEHAADLASTEESIANTLIRLASMDGSDLAAQRRHLADEALAAPGGCGAGGRAIRS